jgi:hypothetical protein
MIGTVLLSFWLIGPVVAAVDQPSSPMLSCRPRTLTSDGTLILRFRLPHPRELAIHAPDGTSFFLVYERSDSMAAALQPLLDSSNFRKLRQLILPAATTVGSPWVHGRNKNELIFSKPGEYKVALTEVLETEDLPVYSCKILYKPQTATIRAAPRAR